MIGEITNHLWQSTVFALAVALVAAAFRKNRAEVRYWLWLSASLKFLVPFSLLVGLGIRLWDMMPAGKIAAHIAAVPVSQTLVEITQPFPETFGYVSSTHHTTTWIPIAIFTLWAFGFFCVALMRCRSWFRIRAAVRAGTPINIIAAIPVLSSATLLEPGVVGFIRPVLLLPEGILKQLTPPQLEAVLVHEQCHVRRRDNLTSALHMLVEAIFWFHPAVWWIGAKLVEDRERACDETVLKLGNEPQVYAEGILNVCKSYLESPLRCVSGVTGADLKNRIRAILKERVASDLNFGKKVALAVAGIATLAAPVLVGIIGAPSIRAQSQVPSTVATVPAFEYEVASIKPSKPGRGTFGLDISTTPDGFIASNVSVQLLLRLAYGVQNYQVAEAPDWFTSEHFDIAAKMDASVADAFQKLSSKDRSLAQQHMLQKLLEDRFKLAVRRETRELPVYSLVIAKNGSKLQAAKPGDSSGIQGRVEPGMMMVGSRGAARTLTTQAAPIANLVQTLTGFLSRPVLDRTGLTGLYEMRLEWIPEEDHIPMLDGSDGGQRFSSNVPPTDPSAPSLFIALQEQLGLRLESGKGPVEVIVIDHVEKPSGN